MPDKKKKKNQQKKGKNGKAAKQLVADAIHNQSVQLQKSLRSVLAGEGDQAAAAVAASICCPGPFPATRYQDGYDNLPTTLFTPQTIQEAPVATTAGSAADSIGIPFSEQWGFAFRDPRRALVLLDHNDGNEAWSYELISGTEGSRNYAAGEMYDVPSHAEYASGRKVHGDVLWGADAGGPAVRGFFPITGRDSIRITGGPVSAIVQLTIQTWSNDGMTVIRTINGISDAGGVCTFNMFAANPALPGAGGVAEVWQGYVRVWSMASATTAPQFYIEGSRAVWRHYSLSAFEDVEDMVETFRANGTLLMYSNTANELQKNGDICGWQAPKSMPYMALASRGYGQLVRAPGGSGNFLAKNGLMGFYKPSAASDMSFIAVGTEEDTGDAASAAYPIVPLSDYLAICVNIPLPDGRAGRWTLSVNGEGRTETPWFAHTLDSGCSRATCVKAIDLVMTVPQWHENPKHIADIAKALQAGVSWARQHEQPLGEWFDALSEGFPMLQPFRKAFRATQKLLH